MSESSAHILQEALALTPEDRAELVDGLLASLQLPRDPEIDELWMREAEERLNAYDRGELKAVPAEEVFARIDQQRAK